VVFLSEMMKGSSKKLFRLILGTVGNEEYKYSYMPYTSYSADIDGELTHKVIETNPDLIL